MGMAAAQAKLLSLTARRSDINYQLSSLMRGKLDLMTQASNAADALSAAQRNNNIFVMTTSDNQQTQLSFNSLSKEGLTIVDAKGRTIVPSSYRGNVKGLANVLPASHPAVKSYDGDFVPKTKLTKNYVSIPENTIPMFAETDPENREQKTVKAAQGEPTVQTQYKEYTAFINELNANRNNLNISTLATLCRNNSLYTIISNKQGEILKDEKLADGASEIDSSSYSDYEKAIDKAFKTELNSYSGQNENISDINKSLGASYTSYTNRKFQYDVTWDSSDYRVKKHQDISGKSNVTYVSNAEQFITALLKYATVCKNGKQNVLKSDANIMLLNDIDLDDMLKKNGQGGLRKFIIDEIQKIDGCDSFDGSNFDDIQNKLTVDKESSNSHIKGDVLKYIWNKYFSITDDDKFNEDFTNFIQIDDFRGAIGGGGFAINNLKMDATKGQFAGMFGCISNAVLDGIWMDNAQVLSSGNTNNKQINASILAYGVYDDSFINVSAKGQQFTINERNGFNNKSFNTVNFLSMAKDYCRLTKNKNQPGYGHSYSGYVNAGWSIVNHDLRSDKNMQEACNHVGITCDSLTFGTGGDNGYLDCGYAFTSYNKYAGVSYDSRHVGWRTVAADIYDKDAAKRLFSEGSNDDLGDQTGFNMKELDGASRVWVDQKDRLNGFSDSNSALYNILRNSDRANSKIKFYTKEDVKSYTEPKDDAWKNGAKFDDGTVVDWQDWDVVDGFNSETGEYTLVKKHGEETEEYLQIKDLLEFYKEQNVRVEYDENRETGCFTYSASGYSIDVEYKEDLNKYLSDNYLYKVENNDSSIVVYERDKVVDIDSSQLVFVDDIEAVLDKNIKNGVWFVQGASVSDASKYERKSLDEIGISETTDEKADAVAQAEYDRKIREIEIQEEKYDAQITELESTLKGIEQEIENQEKIVKQNIQSSFSTFSS